jgi:hypothetical protein
MGTVGIAIKSDKDALIVDKAIKIIPTSAQIKHFRRYHAANDLESTAGVPPM